MKYPFRQKLSYTFDNIMSKGTKALVIGLLILTVVGLTILALIDVASGQIPEGADFWKMFWMNLMRTLDAGTMGGDQGSWIFLLLMFIATVFGLFIIATLIGILSNGIQEKMESLRKGRSIVMEKDHTIILGWSDRIFIIIQQLIESNKSEKRPSIAILADGDKVEMEDELKSRIDHFFNTRIIVRSGDPTNPAYIKLVNPDSSRSIIILSTNEEDSDDLVLKNLLAIVNNPDRKEGKYNVVCELKKAENLELARLIGKDEVTALNTPAVVSRIAAQTCRQSGLSIIYSDLISYEGDEMYLTDTSHASGRKYSDVLFDYEYCSLIGVKSKDSPAILNPDPSYVIKETDSLVVIAEDDSTIKIKPYHQFDESCIVTKKEKPRTQKEKIIIIAYNKHVPLIIKQLDDYIPTGSTIEIVYNPEIANVDAKTKIAIKKGIKAGVKFIEGDTTSRSVLEGLKLPNFNSVIIASYSDDLETQRADAKTMASIMHIRDIKTKTKSDFALVSEFLDVKNRDLTESRDADDFILSDKIISCILAQLSESTDLETVFDDMLRAQGSEIYLKPAPLFVLTETETTWSTIVESACRKKMSAIGYRIDADKSEKSKNYGIKLNPGKGDKVKLGINDKVIVFAED